MMLLLAMMEKGLKASSFPENERGEKKSETNLKIATWNATHNIKSVRKVVALNLKISLFI